LAGARGDDVLELRTQIARTFSLRRRFDAAHAELDAIEPLLSTASPAVNARYLLERGRTYNSAGDKARAQALFEQAWEVATAGGLDGLAVDAAHMVPIAAGGAAGARWTQRGVELARSSSDPKAHALLPALLNNHAWNLFDAGDYPTALTAFREAEGEWRKTGRQPQGRIATWSVARCLRALNRLDEALALQLQLEREWASAGQIDGYVFEEIGELYWAKGERAAARPYFTRAAAELGKDPEFVANESARYRQLVERGR
jgi:tetratricopeptide (TPR) repeat protein